MNLSDARKRVDAVRAALANHPGVNAVGLGEKYRNGRTLKHYAAVVLVEDKSRPIGPALPAEMATPFGPMPLDVVTAPLDSFEVARGAGDPDDDLLNGFQADRATLGVVSPLPGGGSFAISNAHVFASPNRSAIGASVLAMFDGVRTRIGAVAAHSPYRTDRPNKHDVAVIKLDPGARAQAQPLQVAGFESPAQVEFGRLSPSPQNGGRKPYFYASKASGHLETVQLEQVVELPGFVATDKGQALPFERVYRLGVTRGAVKGGHSGAAIVRPHGDGLLIVGLLFAGRGDTAYALSWADVAEALESFGL